MSFSDSDEQRLIMMNSIKIFYAQ